MDDREKIHNQHRHDRREDLPIPENILTGSRLGINRKSTGSRSICSTPEKIYGENFTLTWCPRRALLDSKKNFIKNEIGIADRYFAKPPGTLSGNLNS